VKQAPVVLNFDHSTGVVPEAQSVDLSGWQDAIRFGCSRRTFQRLQAQLDQALPEQYGSVLLGSGDFHHVSALLIERLAVSPLQVVVLDNHPDNMRFPFGIHCGSWVTPVTRLANVRHVHVLGIASHDVSLAHVLENRLWPLYSGKLTYWCLHGDAAWARRLGLGHAIRGFDTVDELLVAFTASQGQTQNILPTYLSIDKDVLSEETVCTNWDQGRFSAAQLFAVVALLKEKLIGSDITGEISSWTYRRRWKRLLSALDGQKPIAAEKLALCQQQQQDFNRLLLAAL
jgi:arginase family enzyme